MKVKKELKKITKKTLIRWLIMTIVILFIVLASEQLFSKQQIMKELNYDITLNEDGSATIVETWEIYISYTNTLFRTFKKSSKFGDIIDVNVKDLDTGENLTQIYGKSYYVKTDYFYALDVNSQEFEVAWGIGMEDKMGIKKYELSYTITDVVTDYKDCQEFYWKLLDESNEIPIKKVTGIIKMPREASGNDKLKAWGHGPLNGNIEISNKNRINFTVDGLDKNKMLEVRVVTLEDQFTVNVDNVKNYKYLKNIVEEEEQWAEGSNNKLILFWIVLIGIYITIIVVNICKAIKYYKITKKENDGIVYRKLKYFRDIPRENNATPGEATYLYYFNNIHTNLESKQSNIVSATILNLTLKGYVKLRVQGEDIYVKITKDEKGLKKEERAVYNILKVTGKDNEFKIDEINKFAKKEYSKYSVYINSLINEARESLYKLKLVDKSNQIEYRRAESAGNNFMILRGIIEFILIGFLIGLIPFINNAYVAIFGIRFVSDFITMALILLPIIVSLFVKYKICGRIQNKIAILTQAGAEEKEEWKALAKYIEDFSMIDEKEVPSLVIWEKYLVYATAFGIADKAIEQMKAKYPEVFVQEYWQDETIEKYPIINLVANETEYNSSGITTISRINDSTAKAYRTSLSEVARHSMSEGSGSGGGFSDGGGGRWWWRSEWVGR